MMKRSMMTMIAAAMMTMIAAAMMTLAPMAHADTSARSAALTHPDQATATAPAAYKVKFQTTKGDFVVEVHRDWAPRGADRFYNLVKIGYFTDVAFFRVIQGFMVQFGIHGQPAVNKVWSEAHIDDDPAGKQSNTRGMLTFATAGPNTRTTQLFINYADNLRLDQMGFAPMGRVVDGMDVVQRINAEYQQTPDQGLIERQGNAYLTQAFPRLDFIKTATIQ